MVSLLVNPDRLESFRQVGSRTTAASTPGTKPAKTNLLANTGLDYQRDIQPWLGDEITLAVTTIDIDRDEQNGRQPGYLMALATKTVIAAAVPVLFSSERSLVQMAFEQYKVSS